MHVEGQKMIVVAPMRAGYYSQCAKTYNMIRPRCCVPYSVRTCPRLKKLTCDIIGLIRSWASQLHRQVAGCCSTEVDAIPMVVSLKSPSVDVIYAKGY